MADYSQAFIKMLKHEGGYVLTNYKNDLGKETYAGISRRFHPTWSGWRILDRIKRNSHPVYDTGDLRKRVLVFYKLKFWDKVKGGYLTNQLTAESIFDFAVNVGTRKAIILAQLSIGVTPDGRLGRESLTALNSIPYEDFNVRYTLAKVKRYAEVCNQNPNQKVHLLGWLNRTLNTAEGV